MFKLVTILSVVAFAAAKPSLLSTLIHEKSVSAHGNSVVHHSAPVVASLPAVQTYAAAAVPSTLVHEHTVSGHESSVVHHSAPVVASVPAVPAVAAVPAVHTYAAAAPIYRTYAAAAPVLSYSHLSPIGYSYHPY